MLYECECRYERIHCIFRPAITSCGQHPACRVYYSTHWYVSENVLAVIVHRLLV